MKHSLIKRLFGDSEEKEPVLLAVTPPRTGERTLLGVENMLASIAVPEPFSLELAGDADGVTLMARCLDEQAVRAQLSAHYPQARIQKVDPDEDPLRIDEGEQAWSMTLRSSGPDYAPLRVFRDDDLLDSGSDPLIALMGALSDLKDGERVVARLLLRSLGPDWAETHQDKGHRRAVPEKQESSYTGQARAHRTDGVTMAVLGAAVMVALKGYLWVRDGETWKAVLMGAGIFLALAVGGWAWHRWKKARSRVYDPLLIREKVSRIAFDAELQVTAVLPPDTGPKRADELLGRVAAAYRHYDHPAGARFKVGKVRAVLHDPAMMLPTGPRTLRKQEHPRSTRGRLPVAPAGGRRRDTAGGAFGGQGADAVRAWRQGRRACRAHYRGQAEGDTVLRRPAAPAPPLRRPHAHGQVDPHAPRRRPQDEGEGGGQGRRRHRRRRSPRGPRGRPARARPRGDC